MPTTTHSFSVGDRVTYRDPQRPRDLLTGKIVEITEHAVSVRYDAHPTSPGLIGIEAAATVLTPEVGHR